MLKKPKEIIDIIHVGVSGVPIERSAAINRCIAIYSAFPKGKYNILAISKRSIKNADELTKKKGMISNISYQFTTPSVLKASSFFKRRFSNFIGPLNEFLLISNLSLKGEIDVMFFYPKGNFFELLYYRILSKSYGFRLISHYVEYRSSFENRKSNWSRLNDYLFDKYFMFIIDGAIPISQFLLDQIKRKRKDLPLIKVPSLVDFKLFDKSKKRTENVNYFLYVGATGYYKAIDLILNAFELVKSNNFELVLILHGPKLEVIKEKVNQHPKKDLIKIYTNLEMEELKHFYINAQALLIPLSNSIQDKARFPQKISEYLASGNPVITTNFGEIKYYFKDKNNALVVEHNEPFLYAEKMRFIIENPVFSKRIGLSGYETGLEFFDSNGYTQILNKFISELIKR